MKLEEMISNLIDENTQLKLENTQLKQKNDTLIKSMEYLLLKTEAKEDV